MKRILFFCLSIFFCSIGSAQPVPADVLMKGLAEKLKAPHRFEIGLEDNQTIHLLESGTKRHLSVENAEGRIIEEIFWNDTIAYRVNHNESSVFLLEAGWGEDSDMILFLLKFPENLIAYTNMGSDTLDGKRVRKVGVVTKSPTGVRSAPIAIYYMDAENQFPIQVTFPGEDGVNVFRNAVFGVDIPDGELDPDLERWSAYSRQDFR